MNTKILLNKKGIVAVSFFIAFAFAGALYAASIFDITYPIPELGNCADGASCKIYCDSADHAQACEDFAAKFGIGTAAKHKEDVKNLMDDGGPGNCAAESEDPEASCRTYCDNQSHMKECVLYGKDHGLLRGDELAEAEKVITALDAGAKLPAGCTNKDSCKQTCENPKDLDTAKQCFAFAEQAGLLPSGVDRDRAEKTFQLIADGKAPFKSIKDFKQCDNPPNDEILQKCISFAADNGLMSPEEVEIVKKTGGKGPGGCTGKVQCETYCENHQDECFEFAQKYNLIRPEDKARMAQGVEMLKESYGNAPPGVKQCISQNVGDDTLNQILGGQKPPTPQIGTVMRSCFENAFGGHSNETMMSGDASSTAGQRGGQGFGGFQGQDNAQGMPVRANFSPEVEACIVSKVGEDGLNKIKHPSEPADQTLGAVISGCFRQSEGPRAGPGGCTTAEECKQFCSDPANAQTCNIPSETRNREGGEGMVPGDTMRPVGFQGYEQGSSTDSQNSYRPPQGQYDQGTYQYQGMPPQGVQGMPYPGVPMQDGQYPPQYVPGQYPMPSQGGDGMYPPPPSGEMMPPGGTYYPPSGTPYEQSSEIPPPPPPPPTSFLSGIKNVASIIFSFFQGHQ